MFKDIREKLIELLNNSRTGQYSNLAIKKYSGELSRWREKPGKTPALFVYIPSGKLTAMDMIGKRLSGNHQIGLYCVVEAWREGKAGDDVLEMMDFVIEALKGKTITLNDGQIQVLSENIEYATNLDDYGDVGLAVGYIILNLNGIK